METSQMSAPASGQAFKAQMRAKGQTPTSRDFGGGWALRIDPVDLKPLIIDHPGGRVRIKPFPLMKPGPGQPGLQLGPGGCSLLISETVAGKTFLQIETEDALICLNQAPFSAADFLELWIAVVFARR